MTRVHANSALVLLALALMAAQLPLGLRVRSLTESLPAPPAEFDRKPDPRVFKLVTFGHLAAAIDWLWIQCLTHADARPLHDGQTLRGHDYLYYTLDLVTDLDPLFFEVYVTGGHILAIIQDDGEGARDLLVKGERVRLEELAQYDERFRQAYWANAWSLPLLLAYVYLFELDDMPKAALAFREAAALPGSPGYLDRLSKRLETPEGQYDVSLRLLNFMLSGASDARVRDRLEKKRQALILKWQNR